MSKIRVRQTNEARHWLTDAADAGMCCLTPGIYIIDGHADVLTDANPIAIAPAEIRDPWAELSPSGTAGPSPAMSRVIHPAAETNR